MEYKALVSFSGAISMSMGEVREIEDPAIVNDLLKAGYIQPNVGSEPRPSAVKDESKLNDNHREAGPVQRSAGAVKKKGGKTKK